MAGSSAQGLPAQVVSLQRTLIELHNMLNALRIDVTEMQGQLKNALTTDLIVEPRVETLDQGMTQVRSDIEGLKAAVATAEEGQRALSAKIGEIDAGFGTVKATVKTAVEGQQALTVRVDEIDARFGEVRAAVETAVDGQESISTRIGEISEALGNHPITVAADAPPIAPFLQIRLREVEFDPLVRQAIAAVTLAMKENPASLASDIVAKGMGSAIGRVTERLSRIPMSEAKRHLLTAAYPALLRKRLGSPINDELAKDPVGLADSLIADLDLSDGALDEFAKTVVKASEQLLSLNLDTSKREALQQRVRASI